MNTALESTALKEQASLFFKIRYYGLSALFTIIIFSAGISLDNGSIRNAGIIWNHELLFIATYLCCNNVYPRMRNMINSNKVCCLLFILWCISAAYSLASSPYHMWDIVGKSRYAQCITHVFFAVIVFDFFKIYRFNIYYPLSAIIASVVYVAIGFIYHVNASPWQEMELFQHPPFNDHIRHVGYQCSIGASIALYFTCIDHKHRITKLLSVLAAIICLSFLMWMGGRGQFISLMLFIAMLVCLQFKSNANTLRTFWRMIPLFIVSAILSEMFSIFDFNGFIHIAERTLGINSNGKSYGTGRMDIWMRTWEYFLKRPHVGYGADSYIDMPNKFYGIHPHNIFIQCLFEWGIIGSALFFGFLSKPIYKIGTQLRSICCQPIQEHPLFYAALAILVVLSAQALIDGTYYHGQPCFYLAIGYALALCAAYKIHDQQEDLR